jgi:hypothetical protein
MSQSFLYLLPDVIRMSNQDGEVSGTCSRHEIYLKNLQTQVRKSQ